MKRIERLVGVSAVVLLFLMCRNPFSMDVIYWVGVSVLSVELAVYYAVKRKKQKESVAEVERPREKSN